jgi:hypothetical protein
LAAVALSVVNVVTLVDMDRVGKQEQEDLIARLRQMPQDWRIVLVGRANGLPAYDIVTAEGHLDNAKLRMRYTYPDAISIEPPVQ